MIILGIDPALGSLGWGIIKVDSSKQYYLASGVIKTKSTELIHKRLAYITCQIQAIIVQHSPNIIAMEETFVNMNCSTSLKLGYARGAIMALIGNHNVDFQEFTPNVVKKTVVGYGHAEKQQILQMIKILLPAAFAITNLDESDAVAIAYTCSVLTPNKLTNRVTRA